MSLHYNSDNSYLFINGKEKKNVNFPYQFCLASISNKFDNVNSKEVSLKGNVYDFSVDYDCIDKSNILNTKKYLMIKNDI